MFEVDFDKISEIFLQNLKESGGCIEDIHKCVEQHDLESERKSMTSRVKRSNRVFATLEDAAAAHDAEHAQDQP